MRQEDNSIKLPTQKKILREDLKGAPDWINGVIDPTNTFMEKTYQALNKNITLTDNIASFVKELTYTTPAGYPTMEPITFRNELKARPIGVMVMQVYDKATYIPAPGPVYIPWVLDNAGDIMVYPITGLQASKTYLVRLVVF